MPLLFGPRRTSRSLRSLRRDDSARAFLALFLAGIVLLVSRAPSASAATQAGCAPDWSPIFGTDERSSTRTCFALFDGGNGPELYVGGDFSAIGELDAQGIARWNGTAWSALGSGLTGSVSTLAVFDDGSGPALYVGGSFSNAGGVGASGIARWNGTAWSSIGTGIAPPRVLHVHDDGTGPALFAGGDFLSMGGVPAANVAKWNGTSWSALGSGTTATVLDLATFDFGNGPELVAVGYFTGAGGHPIAGVARWNGASWAQAGAPLTGGVYAAEVFDAGTGPELYVGGSFGAHAARLVGGGWQPLSLAFTNGVIHDMMVFDDGGGPALYAGGTFSTIGGVGALGVARWNGTAWSALTQGGGFGVEEGYVSALGTGDLGAGGRLFVGGTFHSAGPIGAPHFAMWSGADWSAPPTNVLTGEVLVLERYQGMLLAGGNFRSAGNAVAHSIATWNGSQWTAFGTGTNGSVLAFAEHDDGTGPALYAGGSFRVAGGLLVLHVARWNGNAWSAVGTGVTQTVGALESFDDGTGRKLFAAVLGTGVLRWNGATWAPTGGLSHCDTLQVLDDGSGPKLYAGGFDPAAGAYAVVRWNGTGWIRLGGTMNSSILAFELFDDGAGPELYAGGSFTTAGGASAIGLARWNGAAWVGVGPQAGNLAPGTLLAYDDGNGVGLYAGGQFDVAGNTPVSNLARWRNGQWSDVAGGLEASVSALTAYDDPDCAGPWMFLGGGFDGQGSNADSYLTRFGCPAPASTALCNGAFCAGDGVDVNVTTPCPCANTGGPGRGCANSTSPTGAELRATGTRVPDTVVLHASGMSATVACIYLQGDAETDTPFGDGVRCVGGVLLRLRTKINAGGASQFPDAADNVSLSQRGGVAPGSGVMRLYQAHYRNSAPAFCPPATFNVTNGWRIYW